MPFAIFDYMGAFLRNGFAHVDNVNCYPRDQSNRMAAPVKVARQQTTPRNSPEPSEPCLRNLHQHTPELSGTFEPAYLHQHTPELSGTFRNLPSLPPEPTPAYTGTLRNLPEPSGTCLSGTFRNLPPEPTPAYAGTFRNLRNPPPEPTPAHAGTLRNLPEPSSGTCSCDPHRHTPELIWAEDPSSLRCWGKKSPMAQTPNMNPGHSHVLHGEGETHLAGLGIPYRHVVSTLFLPSLIGHQVVPKRRKIEVPGAKKTGHMAIKTDSMAPSVTHDNRKFPHLGDVVSWFRTFPTSTRNCWKSCITNW